MSIRQLWIRISEIDVESEHIRTKPQTPEREFQLAQLRFEKEVAEGVMRTALAQKASFLLDCWKRTRGMKVLVPVEIDMSDPSWMFKSVKITEVGNPHLTGDPIYDTWNVIGEAERLARVSFGI